MTQDRRDAEQLLAMIRGYQVSQAIHVAAVLGVADQLAAGPRSSDDLAASVGAQAQPLYRLLRALAAAGVFHEDVGRRFSLTPLGELLRTDAPGSLAGAAEYFGGQPYYWRAWTRLLDSVRTGETGFRIEHGTDPWSYRQQHPEENAVFNRAMTAVSGSSADAVAAAYAFSRFRCVVDVGGGHGAQLAAILRAHPSVRGILFDQPHVIQDAGPTLEAEGVADRCEVRGGSFFESAPAGGDAYVLRSVLHDWDDASCTQILRVVHAAMAPDARVLVVERLVAPPNEGADTKFSDLNMLVAPGGQERTADEFAALFSSAGLRLISVMPTDSPMFIIEAGIAGG